jgi:hypothetical protein
LSPAADVQMAVRISARRAQESRRQFLPRKNPPAFFETVNAEKKS